MPELYGKGTKCLIVQTRFSDYSFWNYQEVCSIVDAKYPAAPLGLLTVAALLPQDWEFKLIDENVTTLTDDHLRWADIVCTGGMLPQQNSMLEFIKRAHESGCTVVVGGPDPSSQPDIYDEADFLVLGEGEISIPVFLRDLKSGLKKGKYQFEERADMQQAVIPRYDLIRFRDYIMIGLQYIRGCPFNCEFCDIIELYGRTPRFKSNEQVISEMQSLYDLGFRGHIDFVDDNFIGNKKKVKELLKEIKVWTKAHKFPFYFSTEASLNLADDDELLQLMSDVDFRYVFLGIETPEDETLALTQKNHNVNKSVKEAVQKILSYGIVINGGYIIGFDSESPEIADHMIDSIQESGVAMAMLGLLYALPTTQLTRRLESEGRLFHKTSTELSEGDIDQMTSGLNFRTKISRAEILRNYIKVLETIYEPNNYYQRVVYNALNIKVAYKFKPDLPTTLGYLRSFGRVTNRAGFDRKTGKYYWKTLFIVLFRNIKGFETAVNLAAMFLHFQKQREYVVNFTNQMIADIERTGEEKFYEKMLGSGEDFQGLQRGKERGRTWEV
jgi:radical SAM superfamily enzyme YgiQ (UPF0313 family)